LSKAVVDVVDLCYIYWLHAVPDMTYTLLCHMNCYTTIIRMQSLCQSFCKPKVN